MSLVVIKVMFALGIIGHALNLYCDRLLSVTPNGTFTLDNFKDLHDGPKLARHFGGVAPAVPMRSAMLGALALALELFGYTAFALYIYPYTHLGGLALFALSGTFIVLGTAHHVKYGLAEWVFVKDPANEKNLDLMMELLDAAPATRLCYVAYVGMVVTLIVTVVTGVTPLPLWMVAFTVLPVFIVMAPARIIGTLHIAAAVSMLAWLMVA